MSDERDDDLSSIIVDEPRLQESFTQMPETILRHPDISPGAKVVYMLLLHYARQKGACFPGQTRLAADMGSGVRSVIRYIDELKKARLVIVQRRGLGKTNIYRLAKWVTAGIVKSVDLEPDGGSANLAVAESPKMRTLKVPILQGKQTQGEPDTEEVDPLAIRLYVLLGAFKEQDRAEVRARLAELGNGERVRRAIGRAETEWERKQGRGAFWSRVEWWLENGG